jgi:hypothetical protein
MTAGVAAADITMGGWAYVGATNAANPGTAPASKTSTTVNNAVRLQFTGKVETDTGVAFTAFGRMTTANGSAAALDYSRVSVAASGLTLAVGNTHTAMNTFARGGHFWGYSDGGVWARTVQGSGMGTLTDSAAGRRIFASYSFGDITVGAGTTIDGKAVAGKTPGTAATATADEVPASVGTNGATMDFGGRYSANGITVGAAFDDDSNWQLEAGYSVDAISLRVAGNSDEEYIISASYKVDSALTISAAYSVYDVYTGLTVPALTSSQNKDFGLNVTYDLGGGATLSATAGQAGDDNVAGLGVQFSF